MNWNNEVKRAEREKHATRQLSNQFRLEGLLWLGIGLMTVVLMVLGGCGGGGAEQDFPEKNTLPVECLNSGCAK